MSFDWSPLVADRDVIGGILHAEWSAWPRPDIEAHAAQLAELLNLSRKEAAYLSRSMLAEAGFFRRSVDDEASPSRENAVRPQPIIRSLGDGMTLRRRFDLPTPKGKTVKAQKRDARKLAIKPFSRQRIRVNSAIDEILWSVGFLEIGAGVWLSNDQRSAPYESFWWYAQEARRAFDNACNQANLGEAERAAWHAMNAGILLAEMRLKAAHDPTYVKAVSVRYAQSLAGSMSAKVDAAVRQKVWWAYRREGHKKVEAGRLAGIELEVSEATIRNAFGGSYPKD